jgi:hypothetical protein
MTSGTMQIAAERQRERIPSRYLAEFEGMTNSELAWFADNALDTRAEIEEHGRTRKITGSELRAWFGWELDYREAFNIDVYYDAEADAIKRRRTR